MEELWPADVAAEPALREAAHRQLAQRASAPGLGLPEAQALLAEALAQQQALLHENQQLHAARQAADQYRTLFNAIDEGYILTEVVFDADDTPVDMRYLEANPAAVRMMGTEMVGKTARELDPNLEAHWFDTFGRVAKTGVGERHELAAEAFGEVYSFYVFKVGPVEERKVAAVYLDVTERKQAEE